MLPSLRQTFALLSLGLLARPGWAAVGDASAAGVPWWFWPLALFVTCVLIGAVAVPAGIGGGTLFVPIVGGFFPFHLDYIRSAGLLMALASALASGPMLLRGGLASVRLALPLALAASLGSIAGAMLGLSLPPGLIQTTLGLLVLGIVVLIGVSRKSEFPHGIVPDRGSRMLGLYGRFKDAASGRQYAWHAHHTLAGIVLFLVIGLLGGLFGVGAGWANVPVLNLLMGVPMKVAVGSSGLILSLASSSAGWYYLNQGAVLPMIAVPSVLGMMLGAQIGARLLHILNGAAIRNLVMVLLFLAGLRALLKGLELWV